MKTILGLILIIAGIALFFQGLNRKDTIAGQLDRAGTSIATNTPMMAITTSNSIKVNPRRVRLDMDFWKSSGSVFMV